MGLARRLAVLAASMTIPCPTPFLCPCLPAGPAPSLPVPPASPRLSSHLVSHKGCVTQARFRCQRAINASHFSGLHLTQQWLCGPQALLLLPPPPGLLPPHLQGQSRVQGWGRGGSRAGAERDTEEREESGAGAERDTGGGGGRGGRGRARHNKGRRAGGRGQGNTQGEGW